MFLHLGGTKIILAEDIIMILNLKTAQQSKIYGELIELMRVEGMLEKEIEGEYKSLAITKEKAYLSPISSLTLKNRLRSWDSDL
jgi:predicted transposase YdaD